MLQQNAEAVLPMNELFGAVALTLYKAPRFFIEALLWTEGTTSIHQPSILWCIQCVMGRKFPRAVSFQIAKTH
jgi:hypothetical protein